MIKWQEYAEKNFVTPKLYFVDSGLMCYLLRLESKEELLLDDHKGAVLP